MEYVTEERVREIMREELGRRAITIAPTITISSSADVDTIAKRISDSLDNEFSSHARNVYEGRESASEQLKQTLGMITEEDKKAMVQIANQSSPVLFVNLANRDNL